MRILRGVIDLAKTLQKTSSELGLSQVVEQCWLLQEIKYFQGYSPNPLKNRDIAMRKAEGCMDLYEIRCQMGLQQRTDQRRRRMESRVSN